MLKKVALFIFAMLLSSGVFAQTNIFNNSMRLLGGGFLTNVSPATVPQLDTSAQTGITAANASNAAITGANGAFAEYLIFIGAYATGGDIAMYACGNSACSFFGNVAGTFVASTTSPASGHFSVAYNSGSSTFNVYNNFGSSVTFKVTVIRMN
jgi:hypothetical protein